MTFLLLALLGMANSPMAQDAYYALQFTQVQPFGSARFRAMGGAFGAVGGDLSAAVTNPAGLAVFRRSEISGGLMVLNSENEGKYLEQSVIRSNRDLGMNQIGYLGHVSLEGDWKTLNLAVGYVQLANFNRNTDFSAQNDQNSLMNYYAYLAGTTSPNDLTNYNSASALADLAWNSYLIDTVAYERPYRYYPMDEGRSLRQRQAAQVSGGVSEVFLSAATNYNDKLYIGATLGIRNLTYHRVWKVVEDDNLGVMTDFDAYEYQADHLTEGTGINLKLGLLYRLTDAVRLGASVETPTVYELEHRFTHSINAYFKNGDNPKAETGTNYSYALTSPWRFGLSGAVVLGKWLIISADADYLDYGTSTFNADDYNYDLYENPEVEQELGSALNLKMGAELRLGIISLRGGYALFDNPYAPETELDGAAKQLSLGAGIRTSRFFVDYAYSRFTTQSQEFFVDKWDATQPELFSKQATSQFSVGYFF